MRYAHYKDSGIEWIGKIPQGWSIIKIGQAYDERNEKVSDREYLPLSVTKMGIVPQLETVAKTDNGDNRKLVKVNDFVINSRSSRWGSCGISAHEGSVSLINTTLVPKNNMCNKYYNYTFRTECFADEFYRWGNGICDDLWSTKWSAMKNICIPHPHIDEQQQIANYLDKKCEKIDRVVEIQKGIIERLKEYKQSVITEAVTKGLDKSVPLKDSGIEWIGEIPQGWEVTQISKLYNVILGKMLYSLPMSDTDTLENYLCSANIKFEGIKIDEIKQMYFSKEDKNLYLLKKGDIVVSEGGDAGTTSIYQNEAYPCYIQNAVYKISTINPEENINKFLYYWLFFCKKCGYIDLICNKATIMHYTKEKLSKTPIIHTTKIEQQQIANYLDKKCEKIDKMIADKELIIEKLIEYKKSLIYECVTGKRKVV